MEPGSLSTLRSLSSAAASRGVADVDAFSIVNEGVLDSGDKSPHVEKLRLVERFFDRVLSPMVFKFRTYIVVCISCAAIVVLFSYSIKMDMATEQVNLWPSDYPMEIYDRVEHTQWPTQYATNFSCEPSCETISFVFGAKPVDNGAWSDFHDHGLPQFDDAFDFESAAAQAWAAGFLKRARQLPLFVPKASENAPRIRTDINESPEDAVKRVLSLSVVEAARLSGCGLPPDRPAVVRELCPASCGDNGQDDAEGQLSRIGRSCTLAKARGCDTDLEPTDFQYGNNFTTCFDGFAATAWQTACDGKDVGCQLPVLFDANTGKLKAMTLSLRSVLKGGKDGAWDYPVRKKHFDDLTAFMETELAQAPVGWSSGWFYAPWFVAMDLQESMVWSAKESSSIAIVLAFFTLCVATNSLWMAGLASLTIFVTLIFVLGWLVFLGWDLGVLESMCMAICVGICVDFTCHHAHAYNHAQPHDATGPMAKLSIRRVRVTASLVEMGISVLSAAATTATAAMVLMLATTVTFL